MGKVKVFQFYTFFLLFLPEPRSLYVVYPSEFKHCRKFILPLNLLGMLVITEIIQKFYVTFLVFWSSLLTQITGFLFYPVTRYETNGVT
ncbi:hypothetical protein RJT34_14553 [Clitoria ternatea]|uniref:Uncharacterized protein n=1 Tax=Clitoria ternatea TaxID=43366 RepID=A0AAN9JQZ1_CLITE